MQLNKLVVGFHIATCTMLVFWGSASVYACGPPSSSNIISEDNAYVYATTSIYDGTNQVRADVFLDSPGSTRGSAVFGAPQWGSASTSTQLAIGDDFGDYTNHGEVFDYYTQQWYDPPPVQTPACAYPISESSTYVGKGDPGSGKYTGLFYATLNNPPGGTASYNNRTVTESFMNLISSGAGACWDNASMYPQPNLGDFTASSWFVSGGTYRNDAIGWSTVQSDYYQNRLMPGQGCFVFQDKQNMTINGCNYLFPSRFYDSHTNAFTIYNASTCADGTSSMCAYRSAASGVAK